ncbi:MAG: protein kinase [Gemmatimonadota bacterium]|nr:protein kinase [Gemmatimonadota bacterium]
MFAGARRAFRKAPPDALDALQRALARRYRLGEKLGQGGMADVFRAEDLRHGRTVAIKILKPDLAAMVGAKRFLAEIRLTAGFRHPNILPLFDSGEADGVLYYVMPCVEGETLADRLSREPQLPLDDVVAIIGDTSEALDYAHTRGVVHRDIKPSNILLEGGHAVVSDFGIARAVGGVRDGEDGRLTRTGGAIGSPPYMSPEQATGRYDLDGRSDLYSLGCVAYEMLAGQPPFTGPTPVVVLARHALDPVPPLATARPGLPRRVVDSVERALAKTPADRFATVREFAAALAAAGPITSSSPAVFARTTTPTGLAARRPSVAVLPFEDLCDDCTQAFFVAGMHDAVIAELSRIAGLRVISRTSMARYASTTEPLAGIAETLKVDAIMEGSVLRIADRVRITLRLLRAGDEERLWSDTFERDLTDVLEIHADVARAVAAAVHASLTEAEVARLASASPIDPGVYELYLRGRHQSALIPDEARRAVSYFEQAIALEPGFAPAHSGLARRLAWLASLGLDAGPEPLARAVEAAGRAAEIDPDSADALAVLGYLKFVVEWDPVGASELLDHAIALEPGNLDALMDYAFLLCCTGRCDDAERIVARMGELDPLSPPTALHRGWFLFMARRFDEAAAHLAAEVERYPWFAYLQAFAGLSEAMRGDVARAVEWARAAERAGTLGRSLDFLNGLSVLYALAGLEDDARRVLGQLESQVEGEDAAWFRWNARLLLGDEAEAIRWFDLAMEQRNPMLVLLPCHPIVEPARRHPRLAERIEAMGLVEALPPRLVLPTDRRAAPAGAG